jgi:tetrapyrrole methylase family protein / MazG family protein
MENHKIENQPGPMDELRRVIARLRGPGGCPWDREQTPRSIVRYLLEEAYELADAIAADHARIDFKTLDHARGQGAGRFESGATSTGFERPATPPPGVRRGYETTSEHVCEELGDVLFQVLFIVHVYAEDGSFDLDAVCRMITEKMKRRHPHVFGSARVADSAEVVRNWQQIKQKEKPIDRKSSILDTVPASLPALMKAYAVSERAGHANFDWTDVPEVVAQLEEEVTEFKAAVASQDADQMNRELGDMLFTLVNVARLSGIHPETALSAGIQKFERRFRRMEAIISDSGRKLESVPQSEKDAIWDHIKSENKD